MDNSTQSEDLQTVFSKAAAYVASGAFDASVSDRLYFYSRYKQGTEGPCNIPRPGLFDPQGRKKWDAWNSVKDLTQEQAIKEYIDKLAKIEPCWERLAPIKTGWISVSTMMKEDTTQDDSVKDVFDFVKENDLEKVKALPSQELHKIDSSGMTPLHWACDRGYLDIVRYLVQISPENVNARDSEGQTALHYATSCDHEHVVQTLIQAGADEGIKDSDGMRPIDYAVEDSIRTLLLKE